MNDWREVICDPRELIPFSKNPRKNKSGIHDVKLSIQMYGFTNPICIDQNKVIVCGHTRHLAALELGLTAIPCRQKTLTEAEFINLNLADNKTNELTRWDNKMLRACMNTLGELKARKIPGFESSEINKFFGHDEGTGVELSDTDVKTEVIRRISFAFSEADYDKVSDKLKAVKKYHKLNNLNEVLLKLVENVKGLDKIIIKKGAVNEQ